MTNAIVDRIVRKTGVPEIVEILAGLGASDLQSLLLEVYSRRAQRGSLGDLVRRYAENRFVRPAVPAPADLLAFDALAFSLLPDGFEAVELSPVAPLGATSIVTGTSQNRIVSTVRNTEVAADSTNALALECAARRAALLHADPRSRQAVKLAASQRLMRAQELMGPAQVPHFRLLGLCSAGRDTGSFSFELEALPEHIGLHVGLLEAWRERGAGIAGLRVPVTSLPDGPAAAAVEERVIAPLASRHPDVEFFLHPEREQGRGYYSRLCFHVYAEDAAGEPVQLCDGGFTDWTQQLVGSRKERLLISGMGTERAVSFGSRDS